VLALARTLALNHDADAARSVVLALRDSAPEDTDINLELARLAAQEDDVTQALRFYNHALYAPWPAELADARRAIRVELIQFLLTHNESGRAIAELLAMSADLPERPDAHMSVAQLFSQAGDYQHALQQFQQVLRLVPDSGVALAGAGMSAFHLGQFQLARDLLRRAPPDLPDVVDTREVADLVLACDPLANRVGSSERRHRLMSDFESARSRAQLCADHARPSTDMTDVLQEAAEFQEQLASSAILEQDTIEAGIELVYRLEQEAEKACGPPTPLDRALLLIGREHSDAR
jgi:tetratricopeptide (TPR) repeat protein